MPFDLATARLVVASVPLSGASVLALMVARVRERVATGCGRAWSGGPFVTAVRKKTKNAPKPKQGETSQPPSGQGRASSVVGIVRFWAV